MRQASSHLALSAPLSPLSPLSPQVEGADVGDVALPRLGALRLHLPLLLQLPARQSLRCFAGVLSPRP